MRVSVPKRFVIHSNNDDMDTRVWEYLKHCHSLTCKGLNIHTLRCAKVYSVPIPIFIKRSNESQNLFKPSTW